MRIYGEDIRSFPADPERVSALHRFADVRIYLDVLTPDEIRKLHKESEWPGGGKIRQVRVLTPQNFYILVALNGTMGFENLSSFFD